MVVILVSPSEKLFEEDAVKFADGLMRRLVVGENDEFRAGLAKYFSAPQKVAGSESLRPTWIDEFFVGIKGVLRITYRSQPDYDKEEVSDVKPGDVMFMGRGVLRKMACASEEPAVVFYCAIPASARYMGHKILPPPSYDIKRDVQALGKGTKALGGSKLRRKRSREEH